MIKIALKHWIYDYCINVAFDNIQKNFIIKTLPSLKVGEYYKKIGFKVTNSDIDYMEAFHCRISRHSSKETVGFYCKGLKQYRKKILISDFGYSEFDVSNVGFFEIYRCYINETIP
jgi:hypothetical protein